jgi:hopanoid biosynthesis associated RND transporter like protein HpnN
MSIIHRFLQRAMGMVARMVCAAPVTIVLVSILLAGAGVFLLLTRFSVVNNTSDLLSDNSKSKLSYNELVKDFGSDSRFIILIKGDDVQENRQAADAIGPWMETLRPHVTTILYKINYASVKPRLLFTASVDQLKKVADQVENDVRQQRAEQEGAQKAAQTALDLNSILEEANAKFSDSYLREKSNWKEFKPFVAQFISILNKVSDQAEGKAEAKPAPAPGKTDATRAKPAAKGGDTDFDTGDAENLLAQHEYFSLQGGKALLIFAYPGEVEPDSPAPYSETLAKIRQHLLDLQSQFPGVEMKVTGEPALDDEQIRSSTSDAIHAGIITVCLILALFLFSYRLPWPQALSAGSFFNAIFLWRPLLTFTALILGVIWSLGFALVSVGHFNILSIAVIPMVLGIGIDFGIQILGRYEEELGQGRSVTESITIAMEPTGVAIITGASTTAAAFFTLCFNDFTGLAELGVIAGCSMIFCLVANLVLLPAMFILRDRNRGKEDLTRQSSNSAWNFIHNWDHSMVRTPGLWIVVAIVISIASAISLPYLHFDYNLLHLQNQAAPSVKSLYEVMDASKGENGDEVSTIYSSVVADNVGQARALRAKLLALPEVARVDSPLDLIPADQDQKMPIIKRIVTAAHELNVKTPAPGQKVNIPKAQVDIRKLLGEARAGLKQANGYTSISSIAKDAVQAFGEMIPALERADQALHSASVPVLEKRFAPTTSGAFTNLQKNMEMLQTQKDDRGLTLGDLPPELKKLYVAPDGKILLQVYGKKDLWERAPDNAFTKAVLSVAPQATGTPILNDFYTEYLRVSYLHAAGWAFLAIVVLIFLHFQSFKYLLLTLAPLVLAVLWRTGAMVWLGLDFNPANIVTLPLIIGIDVAFGVYIIDRYREDGKLSIFSGSTGKAIIMSSLTSLFGFSSLLVSKFAGMYSLGQLMSLGIAIGLVTAIFFLPQLLTLVHPTVPRGNAGKTPPKSKGS